MENKLALFTPAFDEQANANIEKNRKASFTLNVVDKDGKPLSGKKIRVKQTNHEFRFGANIFMLDELETKEKNDLYQEKFRSLFNMATLPFYWDATEPQQGHTRYHKNAEKMYRRPPIDLCIEWCEKWGIEPREHALCYDRFFPHWMDNFNTTQVKQALAKRMQEISSRYSQKIPTIEVTNELFWQKKAATNYYFDPDFTRWCFEAARTYFPANQLVINEAQEWIWQNPHPTSNPYYMLVENSLLKGASIDAIGMQFHMFFRQEKAYEKTRPFYNPDNLNHTLDLFASFQKPLQITEITVPAYANEPQAEQEQADILEKLYTLWFAHPAVEQIVYWNLADGYAAFTTPGNMKEGENYYHGGLLRFDMSEKPAYRRLQYLLQEKWHTDETLTADENGAVCLDAFYGDYEVTDENGNTATVSLTKRADKKRTLFL